MAVIVSYRVVDQAAHRIGFLLALVAGGGWIVASPAGFRIAARLELVWERACDGSGTARKTGMGEQNAAEAA